MRQAALPMEVLPPNVLLADRHYLGPSHRATFVHQDEFGVMVFASPTARNLPSTWFELVRWCLLGGVNAGSQQWKACLAALKAGGETTTVVSYSDPSVGHTGALYRACNWLWAPTWHRLFPPPTGNGAWSDDATQSVKDRWVAVLKPDETRESVLAVNDGRIKRMPWAQYREPKWKRGVPQLSTGGGNYQRFCKSLAVLACVALSACSQPLATTPTAPGLSLIGVPSSARRIGIASTDCWDRRDIKVTLSERGRIADFYNGCGDAVNVLFALFEVYDATDLRNQSPPVMREVLLPPYKYGRLEFAEAEIDPSQCWQTDPYAGIDIAGLDAGIATIHPSNMGEPHFISPLTSELRLTAACQPKPPPPVSTDCKASLRDVSLTHTTTTATLTFSIAAGFGNILVSLVDYTVTPGEFLPQMFHDGVSGTFQAGGPYTLSIPMPPSREWQLDALCGGFERVDLTAENNASYGARVVISDYFISAWAPHLR